MSEIGFNYKIYLRVPGQGIVCFSTDGDMIKDDGIYSTNGVDAAGRECTVWFDTDDGSASAFGWQDENCVVALSGKETKHDDSDYLEFPTLGHLIQATKR